MMAKFKDFVKGNFYFSVDNGGMAASTMKEFITVYDSNNQKMGHVQYDVLNGVVDITDIEADSEETKVKLMDKLFSLYGVAEIYLNGDRLK